MRRMQNGLSCCSMQCPFKHDILACLDLRRSDNGVRQTGCTRCEANGFSHCAFACSSTIFRGDEVQKAQKVQLNRNV